MTSETTPPQLIKFVHRRLLLEVMFSKYPKKQNRKGSITPTPCPLYHDGGGGGEISRYLRGLT